MLASLFEPIHRFLTHPQLAWILLWMGLAFLIVALIVMIRTSWGQSHPLRKCAALSLLAHLLLLCYATSVHIVTANGNGHTGGMSLLLVDGGQNGNDVGPDDGADQPSVAVANASPDRSQSDTLTDPSAAVLPQTPSDSASIKHPPDSAENLTSNPLPVPAPQTHPASPLLDVAVQPPPKPPETNDEPPPKPAQPVDQPPPAAKPAATETAQPTPPQPNAPASPPPTATADDSKPPDVATDKPPEKPADKPSEPLPSDAPPAPLAKLPDPPTTSDASDWVAGDASGAAAPAQPAPQGPLNAAPPTVNDDKNSATSKSDTKSDTKSDANPTPPENRNTLVVRVPGASSPTASNSSASNSAVAGPVVESAASPITGHAVPEIYSDRVSPDRAEIGRRRGGSPGSESAVQSALQWLALHQSGDGRWDASKFGAGQETGALGQDRQGAGAHADTAVTGLALLAFLGAGNTHQRGDYAANVQRGLEFLLSSQARDGNLAGEAETYAFMYSHGMATLAMSEAYAMTGDKRLEPAVTAAINYTLGGQIRATGGWRYRAIESPGERGDTSQLGWQLMSLKSAQLAGINVPASATDGAIRFIKSVSNGQYGGKASYRPGERPSRPMTAEALVCRQFLGMARDNPAGDEAGGYLLTDLPRPDRINLYYWYYGTLGMYQLQGDAWNRWNEALQSTLIGRQRADGDLAGSWDPECIWGGYGGRVYSTALSALCLEVYYRYLPLYQVAGRSPPMSVGTATEK